MNKINNNYYDIAYNDLCYLDGELNRTFYNQMTVQIQQIAEKMLKSVLELVATDVESLLHSHNLRAIYTKITENVPEFGLDEMKLGYLKDFYFDAKYPGDSFITVTREQCETCLQIMYDVVEQVNLFRVKNSFPTYSIERKHLDMKISAF